MTWNEAYDQGHDEGIDFTIQKVNQYSRNITDKKVKKEFNRLMKQLLELK